MNQPDHSAGTSFSGMNAKRTTRVAIIGGGITGLAAAQRLLKHNSEALAVTLFEASRRFGGIIRTEEADGLLMELGPDSFITNKPGGIRLCEEIGYTDQLISTDARYRRSLVLSRGKPQPVPDGFMLMAPAKPMSILTTPVLSLPGKLRLLAEALIPRRKSDGDESLASFVRRRFGKEALDRLVQPLVGGIYTADPERLSLRATMPRFLQMEREYGSVIRATMSGFGASETASGDASSSGSGARYGLFTAPRKGLSDLVHAVETWLRARPGMTFSSGKPVKSIARASDRTAWQVTAENGVSEFDHVILTLPTWVAARLLTDASTQELVSELNTIEYASSAIVVSGHQVTDFAHPMDAFGLVVPAIEKRGILAVSFSSRKFLHRAPDNQIVLRTFLGGAMQPEMMKLDDESMVKLVNQELTSIFGMSKEPMFSEVMRYERAMPQYYVGHEDRVASLRSHLRKLSGLHLAGSAYEGVGIPDSIASGWNAADAVLNSSN